MAEYLYRRKGSTNYWLRLQYPPSLWEVMGRKKVERSLGTPNRREAEILAAAAIQEHRQCLFLARLPKMPAGKVRQIRMALEYEPGTHPLPDGGKIIANESRLVTVSPDGKLLGSRENKRTVLNIPPSLLSPADRRVLRPMAKPSGSDEDLLKLWVEDRAIPPRVATDARNTLALFHSLTGKSFATASRNDARKLVEHLFGQGLKSATVNKRVGFLRSICNLALQEEKMKSNPFTNVVPKRDDKLKRLPLTEADMALARSRLHELDPEDQLLWIWLATTGMRLGEPFEAVEEFWEDGWRYVIVGTKTAQSERRVPIPDVVEPLLKSIKGPIFSTSAASASKRLNRFIRSLGITDERKVVHSLRHRAASRLRAKGCPEDIREQLLGHEELTVARSYGDGFPVWALKRWVNKIGY